MPPVSQSARVASQALLARRPPWAAIAWCRPATRAARRSSPPAAPGRPRRRATSTSPRQRETKAKKSGSAARARGARVQAYNWREGAKSEVKIARGHLANKGVRLAQAKGSGKRAAALAAGSAALAGGSYAVERHRRRGGASYNGWWEHRY